MSTRRLVNRAHASETASPAPRRQTQASETPVRQPPRQIELPPYEPPTCPLSAEAQQKLDALQNSLAYEKYKKHIRSAFKTVTNATADINDRLATRRDALQKTAEKRRRGGTQDGDKTESEKNDEICTRKLERAVQVETEKAEAAVRELIDYGDELRMQEILLKGVSRKIASAPARQPATSRRRRVALSSDDENGDEDEPEPAAEEPDNFSAIELLKKAKEDYANAYNSKSKTSKYCDHNEYKGFKAALHDAQTQGSGAPPPHPSTWFPDDGSPVASGTRRRQNNTTDNTSNGDDSDAEIEMVGATVNYKCPLTFLYITEPLKCSECNHVFEKKAIVDYVNQSGAHFMNPTQSNKRSEKTVECPQTGCDKRVGLHNLEEDPLFLRQLNRELAARIRDGDSDDEDSGPPGTQRININDEDDEESAVDIDEEDKRVKVARIKRERARSRGLSTAPSQS
ncbi:hypothetical protein PZA11_000274 [Diplocarpon coronariae]|uniref:SP-RING-type domain-containing protein n=1 Tax=Diplocarpon coronariae TaxID=2795749 RepID=A0A218Z4T5_9HELO|nr:hypothetical protein JHW43_006255 [Diplocarpon mali]OWP02226.1 hypothetical protein B2J93_5613 [Marssonina coronariae]